MNHLGIFVKQPVPGRVKTRLAADIGPELAATLYEAFTATIVRRFRETADARTLGFTPNDPASRAHFERLAAASYDLWPQPDVPLGERLVGWFDHAFATGAERVVVIGSDSPLIPREHVEAAFDQLAERDVVLGPARDGGYYLIGLRRPLPALFADVEWSGPRVYAQTLERIAEQGLESPGLVLEHYDVDTLDDLLLLRREIAGIESPKSPDVSALARLLADPAIDSAAGL